jgi:REP-associated tyrosine transposase
MPRTARVAPGGMIFHVLNRANNRDTIFAAEDDYRAFLRAMRDAQQKKPMRVLAYCLMPNHWHLLLWPTRDGELGAFLHAVTTTHVRRWRLHKQCVGEGHLYQGIYKSFPVQDDDHFYTVCRYVERNALRAGLVDRAEDWKWGSLWLREHPRTTEEFPPLCNWPVPRPRAWESLVNRAQTAAELAALRMSVSRGRPFGAESWQRSMAKQLGLESTFRPRGRPKKAGPKRG